ncbi:uncharacterized protein LOC100382465 [Zea mays]|uniref:Uncharacterized protein n=1 Tax=Zea mays TaxID=4577 RepID=C0P831_MAIZE|nr:uncharacterized protein LOC100382465 [Zea mays]ACN29147.1 unknown [Zea mays]|eukprot:NP_001168676.1 uncharacterized protein LOC100382465 [Zea mays]
MAEIAGDEAPTVPPPHPHISGDQCTSTPASTGSSKPPLRTTKPGVKRLILTASVLLSFLLGTTPRPPLGAMASACYSSPYNSLASMYVSFKDCPSCLNLPRSIIR